VSWYIGLTATGIEREVKSPVNADREWVWMVVSKGKMVYWTCCYRQKMLDRACSPLQQGNSSHSNPIQVQLAVSEGQGNVSDQPLHRVQGGSVGRWEPARKM
jgi:hypothetical protein